MVRLPAFRLFRYGLGLHDRYPLTGDTLHQRGNLPRVPLPRLSNWFAGCYAGSTVANGGQMPDPAPKLFMPDYGVLGKLQSDTSEWWKKNMQRA